MNDDMNLELKKAIELLRGGKPAEAIPILAEILHKDETNANAWYLLAHALSDPQKKIYAFEQVLTFNPDHEKAKQNLAKLHGEPAPAQTPQAPPFQVDPKKAIESSGKSASRRTRPIVLFGGLFFLFALTVAYLGATGVIEIPLLASLSGINGAGIETSPPANASPHATLPATWTPGPSATPPSTRIPTGSPLPTHTSTPFPLPPDTLAEIDVIQKQIAVVRDLTLAENVKDEIMPKLKLRMLIYDTFLTDDYLTSLADDGRVLAALGFINPGYDITEPTANDIVDFIGGFYIPEDNQINVIGTGFYGIEKYIYAHEYAHAIQDQHFDLNSLGTYPQCVKPEQTCLAIRALVEGEANLVQELWLELFPPQFDFSDILRYNPPSQLFQENEPAPPYFGMNSMFPYALGYVFVDYLYQNGGWAAVNQAYANLPSTTEQIIHPEKYLEGEGATPVNDPLLSGILSAEWRLLKQESLGEWDSFLLLAYGSNEDAQLLDEVSGIAVEGWAGDTYQAYFNEKSDQTLLAAHWLWDTSSDMTEFYDALTDHLSLRFANASIDGPGNGPCWFYNGHFSCVYKYQRDVLWLYAPDYEILGQMKKQFPQFP
jgi:hypothetical protein